MNTFALSQATTKSGRVKEKKICRRVLSSLILFTILIPGCIQPDSSDKPWVYQTCGSITMAPIVQDDNVYVFSHDGGLYCLHAATGKQVWKTELDTAYIDSLTAGNTIVLVTFADTLYAFDKGSGKNLWEYTLPERIGSVAASENVYVVTRTFLVCVEEKNGTVLWSKEVPEYQWSGRRLYVSEDRLFVELESDVVGCYSLNGERLWEFDAETKVADQPWVFVEGDTVFILAEKLYKIDIQSGEPVWVFEESDSLYFPILTETNIVLRTYETLLCVNRETGEPVWEKSVKGYDFEFDFLGVAGERVHLPDLLMMDMPFQGALIIQEQDGEPLVKVEGRIFSAAGSRTHVIFSTLEGIACFELSTGTRLWDFSHGLSIHKITFEGERAYITSDNGKIYSFLVENSFPFHEPRKEIMYSEELGKIKSIRMTYLLSYGLGGISGEVYLGSQDDGYALVDGYEKGPQWDLEKKSFETRTFEKKIIEKDVVEAFYESITDLYPHSEYKPSGTTAWSIITVAIELETGEIIELRSSGDVDWFIPWEVEFQGHTGVQYSGRISLAFEELMKEIGWGHTRLDFLYLWGVVTSGYCEEPLDLLEI